MTTNTALMATVMTMTMMRKTMAMRIPTLIPMP
jgi:hypothetical protein